MNPPSRLVRRLRRCLLIPGAVVAGLALAPATRAQFDEGSSNRVREMPINPVLVYFPPNPPPLGRSIQRGAPAGGRGIAAPDELAEHVGEFYYPALSSRLITRSLSPKLRTQLDQYRAAKLAAQRELGTELERVRELEPEARIVALTEFAKKQTPKVNELEQSAEKLRLALIDSDQAWGALRQWRLGDGDRRGYSPLEIAQVMRAAAYYEAGLLPAQRRMLREIAIELLSAGENTQNATAQQPYMFFAPEPARVLLPDDMPPAVAAKVADYQTRKSRLKKDLYDAVYAYDGIRFGIFRPNPLKALADRQAAGFAELETIAEDIRRGLSRVAEPRAIAERSPLPVQLQQRVSDLLNSFTALQREAGARVETIATANKELPIRITWRFENDGMKFLVVPGRSEPGRGLPPAELLTRATEIRAQVSAVAEDYGQRIVDLINEKDAIRQEIGRVVGKNGQSAADQAFFAAARVAAAKENEGMYADYQIAVFQPGLSPAQRRLLFDGVVEKLNLPLPRGELQPRQRASTW